VLLHGRPIHAAVNSPAPMNTRDYRPTDAVAFASLNRAWIEEFFVFEPSDAAQLDDVNASIIDAGGFIAIAEHGDEVIGCGALIPAHDVPVPLADLSVMEVSKMAVSPTHQGNGAGKAVLVALVNEAKRRGVDLLRIDTHSKLTPAITLYEKIGFTHMANEAFWPTPFARCNVQMELWLSPRD
jgi:putative acetyltransferase